MSGKVEDVIRRAEELGVDAKDLIPAMLKRDKTGIMEQFEEKQIAVHLEIQSLVDRMMSEKGLEIEMKDERGKVDVDDFMKNNHTIRLLRTNRELVRYELKKRGVTKVAYVRDIKSGIFTIQAGVECFEIYSWDDIYCDAESKSKDDISALVSRTLCEILEWDYECMDVRNEVDNALAHKDIWDVLNNGDMSNYRKHEFDIYFASQAVMGNPMYCDADVAVEIGRLCKYRNQNYENILRVLEGKPASFGHHHDYLEHFIRFGDYNSFDELINQMTESVMQDWLDYNGYNVYGMEDIK